VLFQKPPRSVSITLDTYAHVLPTMQQDAAKTMERLFGSECVSIHAHGWCGCGVQRMDDYL
jgi:hypothetical protein